MGVCKALWSVFRARMSVLRALTSVCRAHMSYPVSCLGSLKCMEWSCGCM